MSSSALIEAIFEIEANGSPDRSDQSDRPQDFNGSLNEGATGGDFHQQPLFPQEPHSDTTKTNQTEDSSHAQPTEMDQKEQIRHQPGTSSTQAEELSRLLQENVRLKESTTCKVCLDSDVNVLFLPCRHLVCCEECSNALKTCPCCRAQIVGTVKTFLS